MNDCGVACLSMIIKHYGGNINYQRLFQMTNTSKNGTTAYDLIETLKDIGFEAYGVHADITLKNNKFIFPLIAHVIINNSYNHFIVIYGIDYDKKLITIADPASKIKKMSFQEFDNISTNTYLLCYPIKKLLKEKELSVTKYIKKIILTKNYINLLFHSFISLFVSLLFLILIRNILNQKYTVNYIYVVLVILLKYLLNKIKTKKMLNKKLDIEKKLTEDSFQDILTLPYIYYRNHTTGELICRMEDLDNIKNLIDLIIIISNDFILTVISGILLFLTNKILFIILLIIVIMYILNYLFYKRKVLESINSLKDAKASLNSYLTETIVGFESIKNQNLECIFKDKFQEKYLNFQRKSYKYQVLRNNMQNICLLINDLSTFLIIIVGIYLIQKNMLSFIDLITFYTLLSYFIEPIKNLVEYSTIFSEIELSLKRILNLKTDIKKKRKKTFHDIIRIQKNDYFNDDIVIKKGSKVMLTGASGTGKSTLLKTLKQYYKSNNILVGDKNINKICMNDNITYISQCEYLFTDTLKNNITMYRKIEDKKLNQIITLCHLDELIKKNISGINMVIEENGFNLSGGERQRVILARALVNLKDYLFIDEGLSEVDISLERKILKQIIKNYKDKTLIFVSHRMDNLDLFDKLININDLVYHNA